MKTTEASGLSHGAPSGHLPKVLEDMLPSTGFNLEVQGPSTGLTKLLNGTSVSPSPSTLSPHHHFFLNSRESEAQRG